MRDLAQLAVKSAGWAVLVLGLLYALTGIREGWWWIGLTLAGIGAALVRAADVIPDLRRAALRAQGGTWSGWLPPDVSRRVTIAFWVGVSIEVVATVTLFVQVFDRPQGDADAIFRLLFVPMSLLLSRPASGEDFIWLAGFNAIAFAAAYGLIIELPLALIRATRP